MATTRAGRPEHMTNGQYSWTDGQRNKVHVFEHGPVNAMRSLGASKTWVKSNNRQWNVHISRLRGILSMLNSQHCLFVCFSPEKAFRGCCQGHHRPTGLKEPQIKFSQEQKGLFCRAVLFTFRQTIRTKQETGLLIIKRKPTPAETKETLAYDAIP